jgi:hypothetical protein
MSVSSASPPPPPAAVEEYFKQEQRAQQAHVNVAHARQNVRHSLETFTERIIPKMAERGHQIDFVAGQAEELEDSSTEFLFATQPSWRQWLRTWKPPLWWWPRWTFRWCFCFCNLIYRRKRSGVMI